MHEPGPNMFKGTPGYNKLVATRYNIHKKEPEEMDFAYLLGLDDVAWNLR